MNLGNLKWIALAPASALLVFGCGDDKGGKRGLSALVSVTDVAAGDDCAAGGFSIATGTDTDRDGELSEEETENTKTICNAAGGAMGDMGDTGDVGAVGESGFSTLIAQSDL